MAETGSAYHSAAWILRFCQAILAALHFRTAPAYFIPAFLENPNGRSCPNDSSRAGALFFVLMIKSPNVIL